MYLDSRHILPHFSGGWPFYSEQRTAAMRGCLGWGFVWRSVRTHTNHRHRMVRDRFVQFTVSAAAAESNLLLGLPSVSNGRTAHVSENCGLINLSLLVMGNVFSMIFGRIFDGRSTHGEHGIRCLEGARCYSASLYMTILACLCALILARVAAKRDKRRR